MFGFFASLVIFAAIVYLGYRYIYLPNFGEPDPAPASGPMVPPKPGPKPL